MADYFDKLIAESDKTPALGTLLATRARFDPDHYKPWGRAWDKHEKEEWMKRHADRVEDVEKVKKSLDIAAGAAGAVAAGAAAAGAPVKEQKKKRKPIFSPAKYDATTTEEEKDDDIPEKDDDIPEKGIPPPPPLEGLRSPTDPFTDTELDDMHKRIMQKCAPIIDGFSALNIFEVSYVEHKLKEFKNAFKKDYERNHQYVKFFKKANKQGKTEVNADVKGGAKGGSKGRKKK